MILLKTLKFLPSLFFFEKGLFDVVVDTNQKGFLDFKNVILACSTNQHFSKGFSGTHDFSEKREEKSLI